MSFFVYILQNPRGRFYVGQTQNLAARVAQHNDPAERLTLHTKRHAGPWTHVWSEAHPTRAAAVQRERQIKSMKSASWIREKLLGALRLQPTIADDSNPAADPGPPGLFQVRVLLGE